MTRVRVLFRTGLVVFLGLSLLFALLFLYFDPKNSASIALFKLGYSLSPDTETYLHFYSPTRRDVSGGYLPSEIDEFLCERAENAKSEHELNAVVHLYTLQSIGRQGDCIFRTSDRTREKIAARILDSLGDPGIDMYRKIVLLEQVRQGDNLYKGRIEPSPTSTDRPSSPEEWKAWIEGTALPIARERYVEWGRSELSWADKKTINPLAGTPVRISSCC